MQSRTWRSAGMLALLVCFTGCEQQLTERSIPANSTENSAASDGSGDARRSETAATQPPAGPSSHLNASAQRRQGASDPESQAEADASLDTPEPVLDTSGSQTPQECYAAYQSALQRNDEAAKIACLAEPDRSLWVGWYAYYLDREILFDGKNASAAKQLLKQHGADPGRVMEYVNRPDHTKLGPLEHILARIGLEILEPSSFVSEASKLVTVRFQPNIGSATSELHDLQIDGVTARGKVKERGSDSSEFIYFTKESGSWLILKKNEQGLSNFLEKEDRSLDEL